MIVQKNRGFTLIELLIVIAIIGVLSTIVVVTLGGQGSKANDAVLKANIRNVATVIAEDSSKSGFELKSVCGKTAVTNVMNTIFGNANDNFVAGTMPIESGVTFPANAKGNSIDKYYLFAFTKTTLGAQNYPAAVGASNTYESGVPVIAADAIHTTGGLNATSSNIEVRYGCASNTDGWVVWGKLSGDEVFCVDSRSSTGTTALPYASLPTEDGEMDETRCGTGANGIGS